MEKQHYKYIIIGAGLSGLTTAYQLIENGESDFIILEARERIGGRILTDNQIDLGATWFNKTHRNLYHLLKKLGLQPFNQYNKGKSLLIYSSTAPPHYFINETGEIPTERLTNGTTALIKNLAAYSKNRILLNTSITSITENNDQLALATDQGSYTANKVIVTLPPKLALTLSYLPSLPNQLIDAMERTHTWMSNAIKVGIEFKSPFWREKGLSGMVIGQAEAVIELYDHSNASENSFSLMGFVNEGLRHEEPEQRKEKILTYLEKSLGKEVRNYLSYYEKDWSIDKYTSRQNLTSTYMHSNYGNPLFNDYYMNNKLLFSGTETSSIHGGYLEGAVASGINTAHKLLLIE